MISAAANCFVILTGAILVSLIANPPMAFCYGLIIGFAWIAIITA